ncbi:hypothetical protein Hypma_004515 [Hypsizygus marmoreus]|uniref:MULE transposase domain-containing protein n=1 Tax=Hypsizygus marmoreus TaxID=39966 RepID=A0A369K0X9_HYPMA|nr:hypothetical protein Hypma_004515 [Hypsizygus marmoreus]
MSTKLSSGNRKIFTAVKDELLAVPLPRKANSNQKQTIPAALDLTEESRQLMQAHIDLVSLDKHLFLHTIEKQNEAFEMLIDLGLHVPNEIERDVRSKYSIRTSASSSVHAKAAVKGEKGPTLKRWVRTYQCLCGSDSLGKERRLISWRNVCCCSWIRVVTTHEDSPGGRMLTIDEISGILDHSTACTEVQEMDRNPSIGLHPELRNYALSLLRDNIPLTQLQHLCKKWAMARWNDCTGDNISRFHLNEHDSSSLYRTLARERGIPQCTAAEANLDLWFRSEASSTSSSAALLSPSMVFYQPLRDDTKRLVMVIVTPAMKDAAWKFGHQKHIFLDLTFGFCSARANLLIIMAIDDKNKGIPIGLIVFTAKPEAKATHADYDTKLIKFLLDKWRAGLGTNTAGSSFEPRVATTDNDTRERNALQGIWSDLRQLLCMFHVWQCWKNGLNKHLRVIPKGDERLHTRRHLAKLLMRLIKDIMDYPEAIAAFNADIDYWKALGRKRDGISKLRSKGALAFLNYLGSYLQVRSFWLAWSKAGVVDAAKQLDLSPEAVPRTNNHLESFNGRIKNKYFEAYLHTGRLPRLDLWVHLVISRVIPDFFSELEDRRAQREYLMAMRRAPLYVRDLAPKHTPGPSSLLSPDSSTNNIEIEPADLQEMIDDIVDDERSDSDSDLDSTSFDHDRPEAFSLEMDADGEQCSFVEDAQEMEGVKEVEEDDVKEAGEVGIIDASKHAQLQLRHRTPFDSDDLMLWDDAVSEGEMLHGLDYLNLELSAANTTSSGDFSMSSIPPASPHLAALDINCDPSFRNATSHRPRSASLSNAQATTMQDMLLIQDNLGHVLRRLKMLKVDDRVLEQYTTPFLRSRVFGGIPDPMRLVLDHAIDEMDRDAEKDEEQDRQTDVQATRRTDAPVLVPQKKERRKQSYGIR